MESLLPDFQKLKNVDTILQGERLKHFVTSNPSVITPSSDYILEVPRLNNRSSLVPGSLALVGKLDIAGSKSWYKNNAAKTLVKGLKITLGGETVYDNSAESIYEVYKDCWEPGQNNMHILHGRASENFRKLASGDDTGATSGDDEKLSDNRLFGIYGNSIRIPVDRILKDHGSFSPYNMNNNLQYTLRMAPAEDVVVAQSGSNIGTWTLNNVEVEYETLESDMLAQNSDEIHKSGKGLMYNHITCWKNEVWKPTDTIITHTFNPPRKRVSALVYLFTKPGRTDSEEYLYPNIEDVEVTVEGTPNQLYSQGIPKTRFFNEAERLFGDGTPHNKVTPAEFFKNKFCLCIDLRSVDTTDTFGSGRRIVNTQSGIMVKINKKAHTGDLNCHAFIVADGGINIENLNVRSVEY